MESESESESKSAESESKSKSKYNWAGITTIIGCMCIHTTIGSIYLWGCVNGYVCSYLYYEAGEKNATTRHLLMFLPIRGAMLFFLFPLGTYLDRRYGPKPVIIAVAITFMGCFIPFIWMRSMYGYIALLSLGFGVPTGLGYIPPLAVAWRHFPDKKGLVNGVILCAYGSGSFFLNILAQYLVNPNDEKAHYPPGNPNHEKYFKQEVYKNVPQMWIVLVIIWGVLLTIGVILIRDPPPLRIINISEGKERELTSLVDMLGGGVSINRLPSVDHWAGGDVDPTINRLPSLTQTIQSYDDMRVQLVDTGNGHIGDTTNTKDTTETQSDPTTLTLDPYSIPNLKTGLKSIQFWVLLIMLTCCLIITYIFSFCYKQLGQQFGYTDHFLTIVGTIYVIFLGSTRILFGYLYQKLPYKLLMTIIISFMIFCTSSISYFGADSRVAFAILVEVCVIFIGGNFPIYPAQTAKIFGMKYGSQMYGFMAAAYTTAGLLTFFGNYYLPHRIGYDTYMFIPAGLNVFALLILWTIFPIKPRWTKKQN